MPIYEYRCDSCGHELEALQKISEDPLKQCPACEAVALRRLMSAPSFRLKGGGWYETDFKSDKETKRNLADGAGSNKDKGEKPTDSKKDASSDAKPKPDKAKTKETTATKD